MLLTRETKFGFSVKLGHLPCISPLSPAYLCVSVTHTHTHTHTQKSGLARACVCLWEFCAQPIYYPDHSPSWRLDVSVVVGP